MKKDIKPVQGPQHYSDVETKTTVKIVGKDTYVYPAGTDMPVAIIVGNKIIVV